MVVSFNMTQIVEIASFLTAISVIITFLAGLYKIARKIDNFKVDLNKRINEIDRSQSKNYLVRFLKDMERGENLGEIEIQRAYECYEHYTKDIDGNGYIQNWWAKLMKGGK